MLESLGQDIWHCQHRFTTFGVPTTSRMTIVRLAEGKLWLHSPVALTPALRAALDALGEVAWVVAPNRFHHLFVGDYAAAYPAAAVFGARGLQKKRPDLVLQGLGDAPEPAWRDALDQVFVAGVPVLNETVWLHRPTRSLIVTDLCQYVTGDVALAARLYTGLMGVYRHVGVPRLIRRAVKDRAALTRSAEAILRWDFERVLFAHNTILEQGAHAAVRRALEAV